MKKKILLKTLLPLATVGVTLGTALPLISCGNESFTKVLMPWDEARQYFTLGTTSASNDTITGLATNGDYNIMKVCHDKGYNTLEFAPHITTIGASAFSNHALFGYGSPIKAVLMPSVVTVRDNAFHACQGLSFVEFGTAPVSIGTKAFQSCRNLTIPSLAPLTISSLGASAFAGCQKLTYNMIVNNIQLTGTALSAYHLVTNGTTGAAIVPKSKTTTITDGGCLAAGDIGLFSNYVTVIGNTIAPNAFEGCSSITAIDFGPNPIGIGASTFLDCNNLTIPESGVTFASIGQYAFRNCDKLTPKMISNITLTDSSIRVWNNGTAGDPAGAAIIGTSLSGSITSHGCLAAGDLGLYSWYVSSIAADAFLGCGSITAIDFGNSPVNIGADAFRDCANLIFLTSDVKFSGIGDRAFEGCQRLTYDMISNIMLSGSASSNCEFHINGRDGVAIVRKSRGTNIYNAGSLAFGDLGLYSSYVTSIGTNAFTGCASITNIDLGSVSLNIGTEAFINCVNLRSFSF